MNSQPSVWWTNRIIVLKDSRPHKLCIYKYNYVEKLITHNPMYWEKNEKKRGKRKKKGKEKFVKNLKVKKDLNEKEKKRKLKEKRKNDKKKM